MHGTPHLHNHWQTYADWLQRGKDPVWLYRNGLYYIVERGVKERLLNQKNHK